MLFLLNESTSYAPKGPQAAVSLNRGQGEHMIEYRIGEAAQTVQESKGCYHSQDKNTTSHANMSRKHI